MYTLFLDLKGTKTIPFGMAHTYTSFMACMYMREYATRGRHRINIIGQLKLLPPSNRTAQALEFWEK